MTDFKGHSHGEYDDDCPICYLDAEVERLEAVNKRHGENYMTLLAENSDLHEQIAALESKEVCTKPHDDHVIEGCPYCRLEDIMTLTHEYIDSYEHLAFPVPVSLR